MTAEPLVLILNGPDLNPLGMGEPRIYGSETLAGIGAACRQRAAALGLAIGFRQSNAKGELVDCIQQARDGYAGLILNARAYAHTSIAARAFVTSHVFCFARRRWRSLRSRCARL